ncbi:MAG: hypothetical protein ISS41_12280 [Candidatus Aminicenantes bacterium]|nr:hypothetical protein [Candidatus Aminicenantes bacterium]
MRNKKIIWLLFIISFIIFNKISFSEKRQSFKPKFSIKLTAGGGYVAIGDMNKHLDSMNNYEDILGTSVSDVSGKIEKLNNLSNDWELELKIDGSPRIGFGIAASFFHRRNQSSIYAYQPEFGRDYEMIFKPEIKVIMPFGLNLYYSIYSGSKLNIFINSGIGWYLGKMTENKIQNFTYPLGDVYFVNRYWEVENNFSLGFRGGVGFEYSLIKNLALVVELQGRYIRIGNLEGTVKYETNFGSGLTIVERGTLHFFGYGDNYDLDIPLPYHIFNEIDYIERNAVLDLSGFLLRIGIRIKLF